MDEPTLQQGSQGEWVTYLQQLLEQAGFSPGTVDGIFGPATQQAVESFQTANGLQVDGIVGPATWTALTGGGSTAGGADDAVPPELVSAGAPPSLSQWTDEQKEAFFEGTVSGDVQAGTPEDVPLLAMADTSNGQDGQPA
jgi:peptidoglycan hydrolase-like protein with peptidoglycan-binding domain